jgi:outer membrane biosynthesis protein TonB
MDALTYKIKVRDVLFFAVLTMVSLALHAILLFGFNLNLGALKDRPKEKRLMKIEFLERPKPVPVLVPRELKNPIASPVPKDLPSKKMDQPVPPSPEVANPEEEKETVPEAFEQFLKDLYKNDKVAEFKFGGENYDDLAIEDMMKEQMENIKETMKEPVESVGEKWGKTLDARVQMVVNSYPTTSIEHTYSYVPYPNLEVKKKDYQKGWMSIYVEVRVDSRGRIDELHLIRPQFPNELEQLFADSVIEAIRAWRFDRRKAEIHVDVRFYVE